MISDTWMVEPTRGQRPLKRNAKMKYESHSLRLSNNNIVDLIDLQKAVDQFLAEPFQLAWLDLSFNKITHIDPVSFPVLSFRVHHDKDITPVLT